MANMFRLQIALDERLQRVLSLTVLSGVLPLSCTVVMALSMPGVLAGVGWPLWPPLQAAIVAAAAARKRILFMPALRVRGEPSHLMREPTGMPAQRTRSQITPVGTRGCGWRIGGPAGTFLLRDPARGACRQLQERP